MQYQEALDYLLEKLPMFQRVGQAAVKKDLTNTLKLLERLGNPEQKFPAIHVAGTNGKGSLSHMLAAILKEAGYNTGLYTSPHLLDFRERIRINGREISETQVVEFVENLKPAIEEIQPSFFEVTVAMAFDCFAKEEVDIGVIETGLGGRLDSTNVITPEISVITNVSLDHQNMLGDTLAEIAWEKAGIMKPGVPAIIGEKTPDTQAVFEKQAEKLGAPLYFVTDRYNHQVRGNTVDQLALDLVQAGKPVYENLQCDLPGFYQATNVATAVVSLECLKEKGWAIPDTAIYQGLANVKALTGLRGRWEKLKEKPLIICDIAHNEAAVKWHKQQLKAYKFDQLHIVFGLTREKAINDILSALPQDAIYYFCEPAIPRAQNSEELRELASHYHLRGNAYQEVETAVQAAQNNAASQDLILITGSAFVVAEALTLF